MHPVPSGGTCFPTPSKPKPNQMASTSGSSEMSLRRFDGSNFNFWKEQMQDYLIVKGQIDPIENEVAPEIYNANEWQKLDRIVCAKIRMHLSESVYFTVEFVGDKAVNAEDHTTIYVEEPAYSRCKTKYAQREREQEAQRSISY